MALTREDLQAAIDLAGEKKELRDQYGRHWATWHTSAPGCEATCAVCGLRIDFAFCLVPELTVKICPKHIQRRMI